MFRWNELCSSQMAYATCMQGGWPSGFKEQIDLEKMWLQTTKHPPDHSQPPAVCSKAQYRIWKSRRSAA